jgi:hypothetical protein
VVLAARVGLAAALELAAQAALGPVQADPECGRRLAEYAGCLGWTQAVPGDQRYRLPVVRRQAGERSCHSPGPLIGRGRGDCPGVRALQAQA